jgi:hypothetical protein
MKIVIPKIRKITKIFQYGIHFWSPSDTYEFENFAMRPACRYWYRHLVPVKSANVIRTVRADFRQAQASFRFCRFPPVGGPNAIDSNRCTEDFDTTGMYAHSPLFDSPSASWFELADLSVPASAIHQCTQNV